MTSRNPEAWSKATPPPNTLSTADSLASPDLYPRLSLPFPGLLHLQINGGNSIKLCVKLMQVFLPHYPSWKAGPEHQSWQGFKLSISPSKLIKNLLPLLYILHIFITILCIIFFQWYFRNTSVPSQPLSGQNKQNSFSGFLNSLCLFVSASK